MARYLTIHRPVLAPSDDAPAALWLSSNDGSAMTYLAMERIISMTTKETIGVDISPHLFRAAGVSSCAVWAGDQPDLGSALLHHTDPAIAQEHYNHATSLSANQSFVALIKNLRSDQRQGRVLIPPFPASNPGAPDKPPGSLAKVLQHSVKCRHFRKMAAKSPVSDEEYRTTRAESRDFRGNQSLLDKVSISEIWEWRV
jgi:hypothetical protein